MRKDFSDSSEVTPEGSGVGEAGADAPGKPGLEPAEAGMEAVGPYRVPGRDWMLAGVLALVLLGKTLLVLGTGPERWLVWAGQAAVLAGVGWVAGWCLWRGKGRRPFWGEIGFLAGATVAFLGWTVGLYLAAWGG